MQGSLLTVCIFWKIRQGRLGIDDLGDPSGEGVAITSDVEVIAAPSNAETEALDAQGEVTVTVVEDAEYHAHNLVGEETPLLHGHGRRNLKAGSLKGLFGWLRR